MSVDDYQEPFTPDDDPPAPPQATIRRLLQQLVHCVTEASEIIAWDEHPEHATNDLEQARNLCNEVLRRMRARISENPKAETCDEADIA